MPAPKDMDAVISELKDILKKSRNAHNKGKNDDALKHAQRGLKLAKQYSLVNEAAVFQAQVFVLKKKWEEIIDLLIPIAKRKFSMQGHAWDRLGLAYIELKDYERVIECYQKALDAPGYDTPGKAWNNMGSAHGYLKDYERAIDCYQKALATPGYDISGMTWNNMGITYSDLKEYKRAIDCYQKALDAPGYNKPGNAWFNMGLAYRDLDQLGDALRSFNEARAALKEVDDTSNTNAAEYMHRLIEEQITAREDGNTVRAEGKAELAGLLASGRGTVSEGTSTNEVDPVSIIIEQLENFDSEISKYSKKKHSKYCHTLAVLKGWSSYTPLIAHADHAAYKKQQCRGGGYFLKTSAKNGVIIDPGYDFLDNFGAEGFHIKEVSDVMVSHYHPDHCGDIAGIADLRLQYESIVPSKSKPKPLKYWLDGDTHSGENERLKRFKVDQENIWHVQHPSQEKFQCGISWETFNVEHGRGALNTPLGGILRVNVSRKKRIIGYPSDTKYFPELPTFLKDCDIIICHFSAARIPDLKGEQFHENHLGYSGMMELIRKTNAKLYIVSEFWGGKGDIRFELVQKIKYEFRKEGRDDLHILAGDVGLLVDLKNLDIHCTQCGEPCAYEDIKTVKPHVMFGKLRYMCKNCLT